MFVYVPVIPYNEENDDILQDMENLTDDYKEIEKNLKKILDKL